MIPKIESFFTDFAAALALSRIKNIQKYAAKLRDKKTMKILRFVSFVKSVKSKINKTKI